ncbi:MAG TPA: hypothetical protein VJP81_05260 [Candidatus Dormibacteraeota bacterium]|nr:hypothetical protein [Candidatus Dormibacteraeota bacterium]
MRYTDDSELPTVTDDTLRESLGRALPYTIVILTAGPRFSPAGPNRDPAVAQTIWEHGKRNFALRETGLLAIVCPVADGTNVAGIGVFAAAPEDVDRIYAQDPAVKAGVLNYEVHPTRAFPGSTLPEWHATD